MDTPPEEPLGLNTHKPRRRPTGFWKRTGALATTILTTVGLTVGGAAPAAAAPDDDSEALGKFLGGQALGVNLDDLAEVQGALAENPSGENPLVTNPLGVEVLNALNIDLGDGLQLLGENGVIQLGAVNQYAEAQDSGDAYAASGAVTDQGAIAVGGSDSYPSDASLNLDALLPAGTEGLVSDLSLELGALSSNIEQLEGGEAVSDYQVAGATLNLESPAVGDIYTSLLNTVDGLQGTLDGLGGTLENALSQGLDLGGLANLSTDVTFSPPNLSALLPDDVIGESSGVTVDLTTGAVNVDLETLLASDDSLPNLNEMPANSELLSGEVLAAITDGITQAVTDVVTEIVTNLQDTIGATQLGLDAEVNLISGLAGIDISVNADLQSILDGESEGALSVQLTGLTGLLQPLLNLLGLGEGSELGDVVFNLLGTTLGGTLDVLTDLESVVDDITGPLATEVVGPVLGVVNQVVAVTVNAQPEEGDLGPGTSTVRALQVTLLPATELAQVNIASSTVRGTVAEEAEPVQITDPSDGETITGTSVPVTGTAEPGATLDVTLGDQTSEVTAEADGSWTTQFEDVEPGDYTVTATDGATTDSVDFTVAADDSTDDNTADNTEVNTADNTDVNTEDNTSDNTDVNTAENDADNTDVNTEDNTSDNTDVNTEDNTSENTGENTDVNTEDNTSDNTDVNTAENDADNTDVNTAENDADNTDVNTDVNTEDNTSDNTDVNTAENRITLM
ncbi:MAG: choice-of-anchor G family protein [Micrococcaceae bacterium]|nr:choice-of-anchor G family protein [Micrococcaceae bacterium]